MSAKILQGKIVSIRMQKTVVVAIEGRKKHRLYDKSVKNTKRFKARNEINALLGDKVVIQECRPLSGQVTWQVVKKVGEEK